VVTELTELVESIYLHIPFCRRRCFYCDFAIATGGEDLKARYVEAICQEIDLTADRVAIANRHPLQTIFFGGGTPSLLDARQITTIVDAIARNFGIATEAEISLEANPGTVTLESLQGYKAAGVNRISLGAQAFQLELLDRAGRGHNVDEIYAAVEAIAGAGIANFSLDLISGLPDQDMPQWQDSLARAIALQPTHISVYDLTIEPGTAFGKRYQAGDRPLPSEEATVDMYLLAHKQLQEAGYEHYEISNYARQDYQCRHNLVYWHNRPFYGVGMGATSYIEKCRIDRPRKLRDYFEAIDAWRDRGIVPTAAPCAPNTELFDTLMQGLRLAEGISLDRLRQNYGEALVETVLECLQPYFQKGWAKIAGDRQAYLMLSIPDGWLFSNEVIADLFAALE
jgi:putative oxygen-independent coproporphyrinogen III oxidase